MTRWKTSGLVAIGVCCALLTGRYLWSLGSARSGWRPEARVWSSPLATVGVHIPPPLHHRSSAEQATYWLGVVEETAAVREDSQFALGAAWILDQPDRSFVTHYPDGRIPEFSENDLIRAAYRVDRYGNIDWEKIERDSEPYTNLCVERCLKLAELATTLAPQDVTAWRSRALLHFDSGSLGNQIRARSPQWRIVLEECRNRDPENALYDYLGAFFLYEQVLAMQPEDETGEFRLVVSERELFEEANRLMVAGLQKPMWSFGLEANAAIDVFLKRADIPNELRHPTLVSRSPYDRASQIPIRLMRWQMRIQNRFRSEDRLEEADRVTRELFVMAKQLRDGSEHANRLSHASFYDSLGRNILWTEALTHPERFSPEETLRRERDYETALLERQILSEAGQRLQQERTETMPVTAGVWKLVLIPFAFWSTLIGTGLLVLRSFLRNRSEGETLSATHSLCATLGVWSFSLLGTWWTLGLVPANEINLEFGYENLRWGFLIAAQIGLAVATIWLYRRLGFGGRDWLPIQMVTATVVWTVWFHEVVLDGLKTGVVRGHALAIIVVPVLFLVALVGLLRIAWRAMKRVRVQNRSGWLFLMTIVAPVIALFIPDMIAVLGDWLPTPPARIVEPLQFLESSQSASLFLGLSKSVVSESLVQWFLYGGPWLAPLLAVGLLTLFRLRSRSNVKRSGTTGDSETGPIWERSPSARWFRATIFAMTSTWRSCLVVGLLAYAALAFFGTRWVARVEANHTFERWQMLEHAEVTDRVLERKDEILADPDVVNELREDLTDVKDSLRSGVAWERERTDTE